MILLACVGIAMTGFGDRLFVRRRLRFRELWRRPLSFGRDEVEFLLCCYCVWSFFGVWTSFFINRFSRWGDVIVG